MKSHFKWNVAAFALIMTAVAATAQGSPNNATAIADGTASTQTQKHGASANPATINSDSSGSVDGVVYKLGGSIRPPVAIHIADPTYSEQARKAKFSGDVVVALIVGADGTPRDVHVLRGVGMGLDEEAVKSVQRYRFKPATKNGDPVAVYMDIEVRFRILDKQQKDADPSM